jgi:hypothetical protein
MNHVMSMDAGQMAVAERKAAKVDNRLASLDPEAQALVRELMQAYPQLTIEEALKRLDAAGGI